MSTALVPTVVVSSPLHRAALWLARSVGALVEHPTEPNMGRGYDAPYGVDPAYDVASSMSAFAAFPWVRACVMAIADDLSGLPLVVKRGKGAKAVRVDDHPVLALLGKPNSDTAAKLYRMQLVVDLELTGTKYELILSATRGKMDPASLSRLHPQCTKPATNARGRIEAFLYDATGETIAYSPSDVLYGRLPSWADGPAGMLGTGAIEALHNELTTDLALAKRTTEAAQRGRPDAIAYPTGDMAAMTTGQVKETADAIERAFKLRHGGVAVLRNGIEIKPLGWSPSEMEAPAQRAFTRESVLATFGVPPTRLQLPTANYAQSTDAMVQYWMTLVAKAAMYADDWTRLARMMPGAQADDTVEHDFSGVAYLQNDRTARLGRVTTHILHGMPATKAYAYEGFDDAPIEDAPPYEPTPTPTGTAAPTKGTTRTKAPTARDPMPRPQTEQARAAAWKGWAGVQEQIEQRMRLASARYLREAAKRYAARVAAKLAAEEVKAVVGTGLVVWRKDLADQIIFALVGDRDEANALRAALGDALTAAIARAYRLTARQMGQDLDFDPSASPVEQFLGELVTGVTDTTRKAVGEIIRRGLDEGLTAAEIAQRVAQSPAAFGPARAMNIARTESTRALNAGSVDAMGAAAASGVTVRKEWLSARDGAVRPAHAALDGQVVAVGGRFTVPAGNEHAGATAGYPGDFSSASMVCGCRCTVLPVLD